MREKSALLHHKIFKLSDQHDWVVFVHGAGGSSSIWFKQLREFKKQYNVLLLDLRGHGQSKEIIQNLVDTQYTFNSVAEDVIRLMDHLELKQAHFVGISLGTIVIRTIAEIRPEMVTSMIMGGAVTRLKLSSRFLIRIAEWTKRFVPYMWLYSILAFIIMPQNNHKESRNLFIREARKLAQKEFLRWFKLTNEVNPLLKLFGEKEIKTPILYIMGAQDHMFLQPVKEMVARHSNSLLKVAQDCGHVCNVEAPAFFNEEALAFLGQHAKSMRL
ncbi:alpha/beta hydrolase [Persicobacter diffluens]|uniref:2-succinyl-6-hydroxy-2, 4-cyclohexadiene-1-carboxy late synthase n=1 Tax=Persicobacter diffluens TaxID=981 RepID=A0AAN4VTU4_9BACT|nr:2-succinyl-6-hydroxy-2,4-cyclohexadiene-1-carboxy late synthase [Persicobacter diffluens]